MSTTRRVPMRSLALAVIAAGTFLPSVSHAIPPPDFIVQASAQIANACMIAGAFLGGSLALFWRQLNVVCDRPWKKALVGISAALAIVLVAYAVLNPDA